MLFWLFSVNSLKTTLQHPVGVVLFTLTKFVRVGLYFLFVYFLLSRTKVMGEYTLNEALIFFLTYNLIDTLGQFLFREVYRFRQLIISGDFDTVLVKPYHPFLRVLVGGIDLSDLVTIIPYALILGYFMSKLSSSPFELLLFFILFINGMLLMTTFYIIVLALGILTTEVDHVTMIFRDISRMASIPITIYTEPIRSLLMFVIPIGIMMTVPVEALLGLLSVPMIIISFGISIGGFIFSLILWNKALMQYQSAGS